MAATSDSLSTGATRKMSCERELGGEREREREREREEEKEKERMSERERYVCEIEGETIYERAGWRNWGERERERKRRIVTPFSFPPPSLFSLLPLTWYSVCSFPLFSVL